MVTVFCQYFFVITRLTFDYSPGLFFIGVHEVVALRYTDFDFV